MQRKAVHTPRNRMPELWRLRVRLTGWYVGVFALVLLVFGIALFATLNWKVSQQLDRSLTRTTDAAVDALQGAGVNGGLHSALTEELRRSAALNPRGRTLYIFADSGSLVLPDTAGTWIRDLAAGALVGKTIVREHEFPDETRWRALARPFAVSGRSFAAVMCADVVELEDQYVGLVLAFQLAAMAALVLVGLGGWVLAGRALAPVRDSFQRMRDFVADAAHELRTPVTVIEGNAEFALGAQPEAEVLRESLATIHGEAKRLGGILENLLTIARADSQAWPVEPRPLFLDDLVLEVVQNVSALAERRGIHVNVPHFDELPVRGDPDLLRQLLVVLLDNALKYGKPGGRVDIATHCDNKWATLAVEDDGPGIAPDVLPHVFDRFYRGESARGERGAGLGLSIARWIADVHGASIDIDSESGHGTRVTVRLPIDEAPTT